MRVIELRSDTKTLPTEEMRRAMYEAEVGDDAAREDPTVNRLEELAASMMNKEAALFTSSSVPNSWKVVPPIPTGIDLLLLFYGALFLSEGDGFLPAFRP